MENLRKIIILLISIASFASCDNSNVNKEFRNLKRAERDAIMDEFQLAVDFFWHEANTDPDSSGFGLIPDRWRRTTGSVFHSSIAATGFGLAAIAAGAHEGFLDYEEAEERVYGTLITLDNLQINGHSSYQGMFSHFLNIRTGRRAAGWNDISTIDTSLLIAGVLTAGEFFGGRVKELAETIYSRVNWAYFVNNHHPNHQWNGRSFISMGFRPDPDYEGIRAASGTHFHPDRPGLLFNWDWYGEQIILYVLAAGAPNPEFRVNSEPFYQMNRPVGRWRDGNDFIYSFHNSLFVHQFSHAFIDFRGIVDETGVDFFQNSVDASLASWQWTVDNQDMSESFSENSWGLSAGDWSGGYCGNLGTPPRGLTLTADVWARIGTINTQAAPSSIIFTPQKSVDALMRFRSMPELQGRFGLMGSFNLDQPWFNSDIIGIDKGIVALMFSNFRDDFVQRHFMQSDAAIYGLERLGFRPK